MLADEGDLAKATTLCEEALPIIRSLSVKAREASRAVDVGQAGRSKKARRPTPRRFARDALERDLNEQNPIAHAAAYETLARAYLAGKKIPEARDAIERALAVPNQAFESNLENQITAALVDESRSRTDAIVRLRSIVEEATSSGYLALAFEARLRLAEIEIRAGQREAGRARLASLKTDAAARGFALLAGKAQAALDASSSARARTPYRVPHAGRHRTQRVPFEDDGASRRTITCRLMSVFVTERQRMSFDIGHAIRTDFEPALPQGPLNHAPIDAFARNESAQRRAVRALLNRGPSVFPRRRDRALRDHDHRQ